MGGDLASIHSKAENQFVYNLDPRMKQIRWVGGKRVRDGTPFPFAWKWTDKSRFDLFDQYDGCTPDVDCLWSKGADGEAEPNDLKGEEDCVQMGHKTQCFNAGCWNDAKCDLRRNYVCKRERKIPLLHVFKSLTCSP